ncbi:MAG: EAL domain-containing protein [Methylotenera sp.]
MLLSTVGLFNASVTVERDEFHDFVSAMNLGGNYPGIQGLGYSMIVQPEDKDGHIATIRRDGFPNYTIKPEGKREFYTSIIYLEPFDWRNQRAFGYDMYSEPVRHEAMSKSRDSGEAAISGEASLVQEIKERVQPGFLMYVPIYKNGMPHDTIEARRANILGWVYSPFRMYDLMDSTLGSFDPSIDIKIYDGNSTSIDMLMYSTERKSAAQNKGSLFVSNTLVNINKHDWLVSVNALPSFEATGDWQKAKTVGLVGPLISLLLGLLTWFLVHGRAQAMKIAQKMNLELIESEQRFRTMANSAPVLIWIAGTDKLCLWFNKVWLDFTGHNMEQEIGNGWVEGVHPEDLDRCIEIYISHFDRREEFRMEYRIRHHDGKYRWIDDHGVPLFDAQGNFSGYIGSCVDITDSKNAHISLYKTSMYSRSLIEASLDPLVTISPEGKITDVNTATENVTGVDRNNLIGSDFADYFTDSEKAREGYQQVFSQGFVTDYPLAIRHMSGKITDVLYNASVYRDADDNVLGVFAAARDITDYKKAETELLIAATAFESQEGMFVTDANSLILRVNHAFTNITGYAANEVVGQTPQRLSSGLHNAAFYAAMWASINSTGAWEGEIWDRRKNGEVYPEHLTITAVKDMDGTVTNYVATLTDITVSKAAADEIMNLAFYDPLTSLPNRRLLLDRLKQALASSARSGREGALLFLDLDHFKTLNDTLGHDIGDLLLQQVAERLTSCVREGDTVARLGGDEFVVMLENLSEQDIEAASQAETIGTLILAALNQPYQLATHVYHSTSSIGATLFNDHQSEMEELLKQADIAMYQAKAAGRDTLRFFDPQMQDTINAHAALEGQLRDALEKQQFQLYYQIQVDSLGHPLGAEALIRWLHPERGLVSPIQFIPLAEETGLILPIGQWVLETACAQLKAWQHDALTRDLTLSVNVSAKQFRQPSFVNQVQVAIQSHAIDPMRLKLELTESILLENIEDTISTMSALKEVGIRFSLDDFGTGYSSLQYLKQLPLYQLKIDQSFVRDIAIDSSDQAIVRTIIAMAHTLNLNVIAEGLETEEQRQLLLTNGCTHYQGYLFGRPVPIEQFEAALK